MCCYSHAYEWVATPIENMIKLFDDESPVGLDVA